MVGWCAAVVVGLGPSVGNGIKTLDPDVTGIEKKPIRILLDLLQSTCFYHFTFCFSSSYFFFFSIFFILFHPSHVHFPPLFLFYFFLVIFFFLFNRSWLVSWHPDMDHQTTWCSTLFQLSCQILGFSKLLQVYSLYHQHRHFIVYFILRKKKLFSMFFLFLFKWATLEFKDQRGVFNIFILCLGILWNVFYIIFGLVTI